MMNNKEDNMKYNTRPIDYTGCHPVIAEHLKRGEAIECWVWDGDRSHTQMTDFIISYISTRDFQYRTAGSFYKNAEPIPRKFLRIMPPERAIPVLIADGYKFTSTGYLCGPEGVLTPQMYVLMGGDVDDEASKFAWPPCIIEECYE